MTGREKIVAAFSADGAREVPATICYEGIIVRDHWSEVTDNPWWYQYSAKLDEQLAWRRDFLHKTGCDWICANEFFSREEQARLEIQERPDGVFQVDPATGNEERLAPPTVSGTNTACATSRRSDLANLPESKEDIDQLLPEPKLVDLEIVRREVRESGRADLARAIIENFDVFPIAHVGSPLWNLYGLWGYEGMMVLIATRPDLAELAARRGLISAVNAVRRAAARGVQAIWIEECLTDQISPAAFAKLNVPLVRELCEAIGASGMKSIYYYCGGAMDRLDLLLDTKPDALSLEESKKDFTIDIEEVCEYVHGRCTVLGNLDAMGLLEHGSEVELRAEINRQIKAGRNNGSRFIMSLGSPVTPGTPVARVRLYHDLAHEA